VGPPGERLGVVEHVREAGFVAEAEDRMELRAAEVGAGR
jgi:hypothetical protein